MEKGIIEIVGQLINNRKKAIKNIVAKWDEQDQMAEKEIDDHFKRRTRKFNEAQSAATKCLQELYIASQEFHNFLLQKSQSGCGNVCIYPEIDNEDRQHGMFIELESRESIKFPKIVLMSYEDNRPWWQIDSEKLSNNEYAECISILTVLASPTKAVKWLINRLDPIPSQKSPVTYIAHGRSFNIS